MANENSEVDLDLFIGSNQSYREYKRKNQIADTEEEKREAEEKQANKDKTANLKTVLSKDTLRPLDENEMTILKRTRCAHDYKEVFMQSSLDFYDRYYNDTNASQELKDARNIRRIYRSYAKYLEAIDIRNRYIDTLIDKYNGKDNFLKRLQMGMIKDWIPALPKLSKRAEDYDLYLSGVIPTVCETLPEEEVQQYIDELKAQGAELDMECEEGTEESIGMVRLISKIVEEEYYGGNRYSSGTSVKSLDELNKIFKSWYKPDDGTKTEHQLFKNAPENIRKRYEEYRPYQEPGLLTRLANGEEIEEPELNPNEQVYDEVLGRTMTRKELEQRETIRFLKKCGWSEARLLNYQNMGSSLERMKRKTKARKKRNPNPAGQLEYAIDDFVEPKYLENEDLMSMLSGLMRG